MTPIEATGCRICGGALDSVLDLGEHALHCRYPASPDEAVPTAPLHLMRCISCGLAQLSHTVPQNELYREGYGYRSGLTETMRNHLADIVASAKRRVDLSGHAVVLDIASNDGTLLKAWPDHVIRIGIDPIAEPVPGCAIVPAPFSRAAYERMLARKADVITSIAVLYDADDPDTFVADVAAILDPGHGVWCLEVMYLSDMLRGAWDMLSHEHLVYYGLADLYRLLDRHGLAVADFSFHPTNGGTVRVWACHREAQVARSSLAANMAGHFRHRVSASPRELQAFAEDVQTSIADIRAAVIAEKARGRRVSVLGASQKGNTVLQACGFTGDDLECASERDERKHGLYTAGSLVPIVSEEEARERTDTFLVLPWHFRDEIVAREADFIARGGRLIFPLPKVEII